MRQKAKQWYFLIGSTHLVAREGRNDEYAG